MILLVIVVRDVKGGKSAERSVDCLVWVTSLPLGRTSYNKWDDASISRLKCSISYGNLAEFEEDSLIILPDYLASGIQCLFGLEFGKKE